MTNTIIPFDPDKFIHEDRTRVKTFSVPITQLYAFLALQNGLPKEVTLPGYKDIPKDARIMACSMNDSRMSLDILISHPSFPAVYKSTMPIEQVIVTWNIYQLAQPGGLVIPDKVILDEEEVDEPSSEIDEYGTDWPHVDSDPDLDYSVV